MKKILNYIGIDPAITYTLAGRVWSLLSGVVTLLLVVHYLSPDEQGYYYTFASLIAMQILFELGMSVVVMQFASHEMANLLWSEARTIEGDANAKSRLRSLVLLVTKWYGVIAILIIVVILPVGWVFFTLNNHHSTVNWQGVWIWLVIAVAINIFFMPFLALLEGCGRVTEIARLRFIQSVIGSLSAWLVLMAGEGLLALPAMNTGLALTVLIWLWQTKRNFFKGLLAQSIPGVVMKWKTEIWPFQWKIALSWLSGYFIFQLFTPVLFVYKGAVEAGQMGMSIAIANALLSIPMAWMNTKIPKFGTLIAKRDYISLDHMFVVTLTQSFGVMVAIGGGLSAINYFLHVENIYVANRILSPLPFTLLIIATMLNYVAYAQAAYLRAHKEEPFMIISLIGAILIGVLTITLGKKFGATGIMSVYFAVTSIIGFGWGSMIFFSKRREWQRRSCGLDVQRGEA